MEVIVWDTDMVHMDTIMDIQVHHLVMAEEAAMVLGSH